MPRTSRTATPNVEPSYPAWKADAVNELQRRHGIAATAIAERIWTQFYVHRLMPNEAADRAETVYRSTRPPEWIKRKRKR
jgi:hypothetical protein